MRREVCPPHYAMSRSVTQCVDCYMELAKLALFDELVVALGLLLEETHVTDMVNGEKCPDTWPCKQAHDLLERARAIEKHVDVS